MAFKIMLLIGSFIYLIVASNISKYPFKNEDQAADYEFITDFSRLDQLNFATCKLKNITGLKIKPSTNNP